MGTIMVLMAALPAVAQRPAAPDPSTLVSDVPDTPTIPISREAGVLPETQAPAPVEPLAVSPKPPVEPDPNVVVYPPDTETVVVLPGENDPPVDVSHIILSGSWNVQVSRGENNHYYAVMVVPPSSGATYNWIKIFKNTGNPAVDTWSYVLGFYTGAALGYPDIEVVSSNNRAYVVYTQGTYYFKSMWFDLLNPSNSGFSTIYSSTINTFTHCSITSDEVEFSGSSVYLYACVKERDTVEGNYGVRFLRCTSPSSPTLTWSDNYAFGWQLNHVPQGNAITYCPGDNCIHICWSDWLWDVRVTESSAYGVGPWTYSTVMSSASHNIYCWGITSMYGNYVLVSGDAQVSTDWDIVYAYTSNAGTSWSPMYYFNWAGNQEYGSCASNNDGRFSLFYYYSSGTGNNWMESSINTYANLGSTSSWDWGTVDDTHEYDGLTAACIADGVDPYHGGAWSTGASSLASSYFGWAGTTPSYPNVQITLTPVGAPIQIPPGGGTFTYNAQLQNLSGVYQNVDAWIMQRLPSGAWQGPMLGPVILGMPAGANVVRSRFQNVSSTAAPGTYTYVGYVGDYSPMAKWDSSYFTYTKLAGDGEALVGDWACTGEPFPGEQPQAAFLPSGLTLKASPNPFNPQTALAYQLTEYSHVTLRVYDTAGREVAALVDGWRDAGSHEVTFDASALPSGIYFARLSADGMTQTQKLVLLK